MEEHVHRVDGIRGRGGYDQVLEKCETELANTFKLVVVVQEVDEDEMVVVREESKYVWARAGS